MSDNDAQADYWSSDAGRKWITHEAAMDASMTAVLDRVLALAALAPGQRVLDIGCGAGATTGAAAARVGPTGHVTGRISPRRCWHGHANVSPARTGSIFCGPMRRRMTLAARGSTG